MFPQAKASMPAPLATLHGVVFDILVWGEKRVGLAVGKRGLPGRSSQAGQPAFARWASAWQPSLASRAKAGTHMGEETAGEWGRRLPLVGGALAARQSIK